MAAPFDYAGAAQRLRARSAAREAELAARLERARQEAAAIVAMMVRQYQPQRVWQWGSLVHGRGFGEASDIDIAVEGVTDPQRFSAMFAEAEKLVTFDLDLVSLESIDARHSESIRRKGRLVYDRSKP